jgi:DNA-binding response OmpR family regulator
MHVLLVEDERHVRRALARSMTAWGHAVTEAEDGRAALDALVGTDFDLIVLDVNLPDMTGWDVLRSIRSAGAPEIPVIVISAIAPSVDRQHEFRPFGVLHKPFPIASLQRLLSLAGSWHGSVPGMKGGFGG